MFSCTSAAASLLVDRASGGLKCTARQNCSAARHFITRAWNAKQQPKRRGDKASAAAFVTTKKGATTNAVASKQSLLAIHTNIIFVLLVFGT